jgi:hypothetical protein
MTMMFVTTKKQTPWFAIFPWNMKPVAEPTITAIIAGNEKLYIYNFLVKTNKENKTRADVNIGIANSEYSLCSWSNTSEL